MSATKLPLIAVSTIDLLDLDAKCVCVCVEGTVILDRSSWPPIGRPRQLSTSTTRHVHCRLLQLDTIDDDVWLH